MPSTTSSRGAASPSTRGRCRSAPSTWPALLCRMAAPDPHPLDRLPHRRSPDRVIAYYRAALGVSAARLATPDVTQSWIQGAPCPSMREERRALGSAPATSSREGAIRHPDRPLQLRPSVTRFSRIPRRPRPRLLHARVEPGTLSAPVTFGSPFASRSGCGHAAASYPPRRDQRGIVP